MWIARAFHQRDTAHGFEGWLVNRIAEQIPGLTMIDSLERASHPNGRFRMPKLARGICLMLIMVAAVDLGIASAQDASTQLEILSGDQDQLPQRSAFGTRWPTVAAGDFRAMRLCL